MMTPDDLLPKGAAFWPKGPKKMVPKDEFELLMEKRAHLIDDLVSEAESCSAKEGVQAAAFAAAVGCTPEVLHKVDSLYVELEKEYAERVAVLDRSFAELHAKRDAYVASLFDSMDAATREAGKLTKTIEYIERANDLSMAPIDGAVARELKGKRDACLAAAAEVRDQLLAWYSPQPQPFVIPKFTIKDAPSDPLRTQLVDLLPPKLSAIKLSPAVRGRVDSLVADHLAGKKIPQTTETCTPSYASFNESDVGPEFCGVNADPSKPESPII
jgi:hypothetical protein